MTTIRRIYAYLLAFAGLAMFTVAAANLAQLLIDVVLESRLTSTERYVRDMVALDGATAIVGLAVWLLHWLWIQRTARADSREQASTLRRLYLYAVLAAATLVAAASMYESLRAASAGLIGVGTSDRLLDTILRPLPFTLVALTVWVAHLRVTGTDRAEVGERGGSATLRRWYIYGAAFIGFLVLLSGTQGLLEDLWRFVTTSTGRSLASIPVPASAALVGLGLWVFHWAAPPGRLVDKNERDDGVAALRSVYLFLGLAVGVLGALLGASQLLYYGVGRLLGVERPGGIGGDLIQAAAGPATVLLVYGAAWAYQRQAVRRQASAVEEAPRQAGIRRLYTYLVSLVSLAVLSTGVAGLFWALCDLLMIRRFTADTVALYATMTIVGLPVWVLHWRPKPDSPGESHSLARRLYVYLSLIVASLTLVGSAAAVLYRLIGLALGGVSSGEILLDLTHALALSAVAASVAAYHWRILRVDARQVEPIAVEAAEPAEAMVEIHAIDAAALNRALAALRSTGVEVKVR